MTILALDTSALAASVAVTQNSLLLGEFFVSLKLTHSETIMPMLDKLLAAIDLTPFDIDYIAVSQGPGSFTGLRIGAAAAQGLAIALNKDIVPVPTLDALAYSGYKNDSGGIIVPIMDAKRGEVYTAIYAFENTRLKRLTDYMADDLQAIINLSKTFSNDVVYVGDGTDACKDLLVENNCTIAPPHLNRQRAAAVAVLAAEMAETGNAVPPERFAPMYLRKPQAERALEAKA